MVGLHQEELSTTVKTMPSRNQKPAVFLFQKNNYSLKHNDYIPNRMQVWHALLYISSIFLERHTQNTLISSRVYTIYACRVIFMYKL